MTTAELIARCSDIATNTTPSLNAPWTAANVRAFSREINRIILEMWESTPCAHNESNFTVGDVKHCGICLRRIEEPNAKEANNPGR